VLAGTVALAAAGRILGIFELFVLAAGAAALVVVGAIGVLRRRIDLDASRTVHPARIHVGADSRVELVVANRGQRPSPVVAVRDTFAATSMSPPDGDPGTGAGRRQARFLLAPLGRGQQERAVYRLPAERRGIFGIGPLEAEVTDAFGLWARVITIAPVVELTVFPEVEALAPIAQSRGDHLTSGAPRRATVGPGGEDLYGLRPYEVGDDLRRVQEELLAGRGRDHLRTATTARRATLDELADVALGLLSGMGRTGVEAHRDDVLATLEAASLETDAGASLLQGRLAAGLAPTAGFDLLGGSSRVPPESQAVAAVTEPETRPSTRSPATDAVARQARLAEARQVAADARELARRRRTEAAEVAGTAALARRVAHDTDEEVEQLTRDLEKAHRTAARAASAADDAASRIVDAERAAARAETQAATAEASLARLEGG